MRTAAALLAAAVGGCAVGLGSLRDGELPPRARVNGVVAFAQAEHHCGPAALASLLGWAGRPETPQSLAPRVYTPTRSGTFPLELPREIRARGLLAYRIRPDTRSLLAEIAAGHPALLLENRGLSWLPVWHYSVLTGYDLGAGEATLLSGAASPETVSLTTLARTWRRAGAYALVALPPGALPAADDPEGVLEALADLEEVAQPSAAAEGYAAALERWPDQWRAALGWANALHALGRDDLAARALRRAHGTAPERPEPLNNLALLAAAAGERREAEALAREALAKAGSLQLDPSPYEETLREVLAAP